MSDVDVVTYWVGCVKRAPARYEVAFRESKDSDAKPIDLLTITRETTLVFIPDYSNSSHELNGFRLKACPSPKSDDIKEVSSSSDAPANTLTLYNRCAQRAEINLGITIMKPGDSVNSGKPTIRNWPPLAPGQPPSYVWVGLLLLLLALGVWAVGHLVLKAF